MAVALPSAAMPAKKGVPRTLLVLYNEEELYHERLLLARVKGSRHIVASPDLEVFPMTLTSPPHDDIRVLPYSRKRPVDLSASDVYGFEVLPKGAELEELMRVGAEIAEGERMLLGEAEEEEVVEAVEMSWVVAEPVKGKLVGEVVDPPADWTPTTRTRGLLEVDGAHILVERIRDSAVEGYRRDRVAAFREAKAGGADDFEDEDIRTLSVNFNANGRRGRRFADTVELMFETDLPDMELEGPRTALWWLQACARTGGTALTRHHRWVAEGGIPRGDRAVHEHEVLSRIVDSAVLFDSLNAANLLSFEVVCRRLQLIEAAHLGDPTAPDYGGSEHFLGHGEQVGGALVAPTLRSHVAAKLKDEAAIQKERRTAREERKLGKGRGGGRGGGDDGQGRGRGAPAAPKL